MDMEDLFFVFIVLVLFFLWVSEKRRSAVSTIAVACKNTKSGCNLQVQGLQPIAAGCVEQSQNAKVVCLVHVSSLSTMPCAPASQPLSTLTQKLSTRSPRSPFTRGCAPIIRRA